MPIIDVQIVGEIEVPSRAKMTQIIADRVGGILKARVGGTWVRLHFFPADCYAESGNVPSEVMPVFVSVLTGKRVEIDDRSRIALELASAISEITSRPEENIHIVFEPEAVGRIAFGGKLVRSY